MGTLRKCFSSRKLSGKILNPTYFDLFGGNVHALNSNMVIVT
jgi:hypothetical protein